MKKIIIVAILLSNISYGANTRQFPVSARCWFIKEETHTQYPYQGFHYCEMTNGDVCYLSGRSISCFKG